RIIARAKDLSKLAIRPAIQAVAYIRASKIVTEKLAAVLRVVECVQEFSAKLCFEPLGNVEALGNGEINILSSTFAQLRHPLRLIAISEGSRSSERVGVDPVVGRLVRRFRISDSFRQSRSRKTVRTERIVLVVHRKQGQTAG